MLTKLKLLLNVGDASKDDVLLIYLQMVTDEVLNYINQTVLPTALENVVVAMTKEYYEAKTNPAPLKKLKRGDTEWEYGQQTATEFVASYAKQLNAFRKVRW